jgi:hypothetical protein
MMLRTSAKQLISMPHPEAKRKKRGEELASQIRG